MVENLKAIFSNFKVSLRIIIFLVLSFFIISTSSEIYDTRTSKSQNTIYSKLNTDILNITKTLIEKKQNATLLSAIAMSKNPILIDIIFGKPDIELDLKSFSEEIKDNSNFKNTWFSIIDAEGTVVQRSWTQLVGDDLTNDNDIDDMIKYPQVKSVLTINQFGLVLNTMVPIIYDDDFIGILSVMTHFNSIVNDLSKYDFKTVIFLNEKKSNKIDIRTSLSKRFIGDAYVVNTNVDDVAVRLVEDYGLEHYIEFEDSYHVHEHTNTFETVYRLQDNRKNDIGYIVLTKALDTIDLDNIKTDQDIQVGFTVFIIIAIGLISYYRHTHSYIREVKQENEKLTLVNSTLNDKNDELDFNEKKIANMFYIQPNFVILSDGQQIENANERMLWLLNGNSGGGIKEIQSKYNDVSVLFEESDNKDIDLSEYIHESKIDGKLWIDYILENFKRNYKTCIKDPNGRQHHFAIKMNEMKYVKFVKRYIVITFIDITADIFTRQKELAEQKKSIESKNKEQLKDLISDITNQLHEPVSNISLIANDLKFKNDTGNIQDNQIDELADKIIEKSVFISSTLDNMTTISKDSSSKENIS